MPRISYVVRAAIALVAATPVAAAPPPLLPEPVAAALAREVSGAEALRTARALTAEHRQRGSRGFAAAAEAVRSRLEGYGLDEVEVLRFPADGERFYGAQRSRPAWDADFAELWEVGPGGERIERIVSWETAPLGLAQDSATGEATAELVDVGEGVTEADYAGKEVRGRFVLTSSQPGAVQALAAERFGAAGIVSWARNQRSAWWGDDPHQVRWGHLESFPAPRTFAFMVSPARAREWRERLEGGGTVRLEGVVRAGQHPGEYLVPTALLRGGDPAVAHEEVAFSCHLDHPRPGANDNASGCAAILEVARAYGKLVGEGALPRPRRSLRFYWPAEIEGTMALLAADPVVARRTVAVVHMDMVGGAAAATGAIFHVTRTPASLPTVVDDVAEAIARWMNAETQAYASTGAAEWPLVDPAGTKDPLRAEVVPFTMGSDHQVWTEGSYRVPAIYLNDWPDRTIHTDRDTVENLDPTKLLRAAFLGAASGWALAGLDREGLPELWEVVRRHTLERVAGAMARAETIGGESADEAASLLRHHFARERAVLPSVGRFADVPPRLAADARAFFDRLEATVGVTETDDEPPAEGAAARVLARTGVAAGPLAAFGYDWLAAHLDERGLARPALLDRAGRWGAGDELAYEALNLLDGHRTVAEVGAALAATYGQVPLGEVVKYLETLETLGVVAPVERREATSWLGDPLVRSPLPLSFRVGQEELRRRAEREAAARPAEIAPRVWIGRRTAYLGRVREAIAVYTQALVEHPDDPELLRHRGHRYLTVRELDRAIADLTRAAERIEGRPDRVEPDGLPNLADRPTSTLATNVWYHLGLAHHLRGDEAAAIAAWERGLALSEDPDMWIATAYWLALARRADGREEAAAALLAEVPAEVELLESHDYHRLLLAMRGDLDPEALLAPAREAGGVTWATVGYGVGAILAARGDAEGAAEVFRQVVAGEAWEAFGHLAAEAALARRTGGPV